eukprot:1195341-Prorocentrum_minimum.AAC.6
MSWGENRVLPWSTDLLRASCRELCPSLRPCGPRSASVPDSRLYAPDEAVGIGKFNQRINITGRMP